MAWVLGQSLINGLLSGGVYALVAVGITIIFGVMKIVNFASGSYLVWGMYFTWIWHNITGANAYILIPCVILSMCVLGFVSFSVTLRPILGKGATTFILVTVGLSFFLQNLAEFIFGATSQSVPSNIKSSSIMLGSFSVGLPRLISFGVAVVLVLLVNALLNNTLMGRAMRATSENPEVAEMLGINSIKTFTLAFILGVVFSGLAGLLLTPLYYVNPSAGNAFRTSALMVVVLGGMGSIKGAMIGGLLVGLVEALVGGLVDPILGPAGIFVLFLAVLYFKPNGLFGRRARTA